MRDDRTLRCCGEKENLWLNEITEMRVRDGMKFNGKKTYTETEREKNERKREEKYQFDM